VKLGVHNVLRFINTSTRLENGLSENSNSNVRHKTLKMEMTTVISTTEYPKRKRRRFGVTTIIHNKVAT
jgi:hypothetical protein